MFGFADDTPEMTSAGCARPTWSGPAGFISMEDGAVGGFVQRGIAAPAARTSVVEMGGSGTATEDSRATEASVRGFWKAYRAIMGL